MLLSQALSQQAPGPRPASSLPWRAGYTQAAQPCLLEACFGAHALHRVTDEAHLPSFHGRVISRTLISANGSFLHKFYRAGRWEASHTHSSWVFLTTGFIPLVWNWLLCVIGYHALELPTLLTTQRWTVSNALCSRVQTPPTCAIRLAGTDIQLVQPSQQSPMCCLYLL